MRIIEVSHETVAEFLKKGTEKFWLGNNGDAYIRFTDGSVVCIHVLDYKWETHVVLDSRGKLEATNGTSFNDSQDVYLWYTLQGDERLITSRTVSIDFDAIKYYINNKFQYPTRQYIPIVEFHYYEKGEAWE